MQIARVIGKLGRTVALIAAFSASAAYAEIKISVEDIRGVVVTKAQWQPLADYLTAEIGQPVTVVPLTSDKAMEAAAARQVDFMLGNPAITAMVQKTQDTQLVATLLQPWGNRFGGVIFTTPATGIKSAAELRGKKLITHTTSSAGGNLFQRDHLRGIGIDTSKDFSSIKEVPRQDDIVLAVKSGIFDVGFVRTGIIEDMIKKGKVEMSDFVIIDKVVTDASDPLVRSTALFPEWYVAALKGVDPAVTTKVKTALLAVKPDSKVAEAGGIKGFQEALPITPMTDLLANLKIAPFDK